MAAFSQEELVMATIKKVIQNTMVDSEFHIHLGNFLDEFYRATRQQKQNMLVDSPLLFAEEVNIEFIAYVAATAHKLANDYNLEVPPWVFEKKCLLSILIPL